MARYGITYDELMLLQPCDRGLNHAVRRLGGPKRWDGNKVSVADAVDAKVRTDYLIWAIAEYTSSMVWEDEDKSLDLKHRCRRFGFDCLNRGSELLSLTSKEAIIPWLSKLSDNILTGANYEIPREFRGGTSAREVVNHIPHNFVYAIYRLGHSPSYGPIMIYHTGISAARDCGMAKAYDAWARERLIHHFDGDEPGNIMPVLEV